MGTEHAMSTAGAEKNRQKLVNCWIYKEMMYMIRIEQSWSIELLA